MSSQPPTKKAKTISHNGSAPVSSDGSTNVHLSPELISRIATYADMSNSGVMNICLAVGPIAARPIRNCYLKNNVKYLNTTLKELLIVRRHANESFRRDKAGANHREWMEVNADWKTIVTSDTDITAIESVLVKDAIQSGDHPFLAFNNAAFAVELGLIDVVKFLIEDKGVDPNSFGWTMYRGRLHRLHLVAIAMYTNRCDIFHYLVSLPSIRLLSDQNDGGHSGSLFEVAVRLFCKEEVNFVKGFVANPNFDINKPSNCITFASHQDWLPCLHVCLDALLDYSLSLGSDSQVVARHLDLIKAVLSAGADVNRSYTDVGTALDYLRRRVEYNPHIRHHGATQAVLLMEAARDGRKAKG